MPDTNKLYHNVEFNTNIKGGEMTPDANVNIEAPEFDQEVIDAVRNLKKEIENVKALDELVLKLEMITDSALKARRLAHDRHREAWKALTNTLNPKEN